MNEENLHKENEDSWRYLVKFATIATIFGFLITCFQFFKKDTIVLEVNIIDKMQLTKDLGVENLTTKYTYQDREVNNIWKVRCLILNTGTKTIVGKGNNKDILTENLLIRAKDSVKILSAKINTTNFPISVSDSTDNAIGLDFKQWRQSKFIDITFIVEIFEKVDASIYIDEQDIIDSEVIFSEYEPNTNKKLIEYVPNNTFSFLIMKGITVLFIILSNTILWGLGIRDSLKGNSKNIFKIAIIILYVLCFIYTTSLPLLWIF
jgi:hypothetical protein